MRIAFIDTAFPINNRTLKFVNTCNRFFDIMVIAWNRKNEHISNYDNYRILNCKAEYGNKLKKFFKIFKFIKHIYSILKSEKIEIIFASHWDSLLCAIIATFFLKNKYKIVYDCLDLPTAKNYFLVKILRFLESRCLKRVNSVIFASRYFPGLYKSKPRYMIFENYPSIKIISEFNKPDWYDKFKNEVSNSTVISWIGVVRYKEIILNIMQAIQNMDFDCKLCIFGDGPDLNFVLEKSKELNLTNKILFFGRYSQKEIKYIYEITDIVWAAYPTNDYNVVYAISNKYFEASLFGRVIAISKKAKMCNRLKKFTHSSILVDEYSAEDIAYNIKRYKNYIKKYNYEKYEEGIFWEDVDNKVIKELKFIGADLE